MSIQIKSSEVLEHLNNYGITSVDDEALKLFIKDLKKLIKYELRKNSEKLTSELNESHSQQKQDTFMPAQSRSSSPSPDIASKSIKVKSSETKPSKEKEPAEPIGRPASLSSHTRSHSGGRTKKLSRDPVELYQYYQSIWKRHTLPGENDHAQLRRSIRDRLMKGNFFPSNFYI
ncbi:hypothetical protein V9T40_013933 [Parthenolecanium corni]|uniref:Centriolar and ciliogenesis-associated protein HYLS1 C-terminal domain-containing protein n=1 Tax=Parthenolecanium corni TaxID=536013 RepID=A0AAN9Y2Y6_9HEMI